MVGCIRECGTHGWVPTVSYSFFIFWPCWAACGNLSPPQDWSPALSNASVESYHWTARGCPILYLFNQSLFWGNLLVHRWFSETMQSFPVPLAVSSNGNISQNFTAASPPGCGHWYGTRCRTVRRHAVPPVDLSQPPLLSFPSTKSLAIINLFSISEFCHFENVRNRVWYVIIRDWGFCPLSKGLLTFIQLFSCICSSFLLLISSLWYGCLWSTFTCGRISGWFQFGAIMNKAATYVHAQVFVWTWFSFLWGMQECRSGSCDTCMFNF